MSKTLVVIIYSPNLRNRRTVIVPDATDDPNTWDSVKVPMHAANLVPGEAALIGTLADYHAIGPDAMLAKQFSASPSNHQCAVVNAFGVVVDRVLMDPKIDAHPHGALYHDPLGLAKVGSSIYGLGLSQ